MTPSDLISELNLVAPHQRVMVQHFFLVLAENVRRAQLKNGKPLCLIADFEAWLVELAEAAEPKIASVPPQPRYKSEAV